MVAAGGPGALAQLGEHRLCKAGVVGSIPTRSINRHLPRLAWVHPVRGVVRFGRPRRIQGAGAALGVEVLPISVDAVPSLKEFRSKYHMKVDLLSDFKREASRAFGVLREDAFFSKRSYFLVDREGVVRWAHVEEKQSQMRESVEVHAAIKAALG